MNPDTAASFRAGVARRDIAPPQPRLLKPTGMGRPHPTRGVLDPLFVEALAVQAAGRTGFVITADLRTFEPKWVTSIRETVADRTGCDPWAILFSSTHNHCSSPAAADNSPVAVAAAEEANLKICDATVAACCAAFESMRPAEWASATTHLAAPIGENRRMRFSGGICLNSWGAGPIVPPGRRITGPAGPDSTRIDMMAVRAPGAASPFALLVSYATHPHLYELPAFSGEFPGAAKRILAERLPGTTILHANHAGGDIDIHCVHPMPDDPEAKIAWFQESAHRMGERFADAVVPAIPADGYTRPADLRHTHFTTEHQVTDPAQRPVYINALALGDTALLSIPGELFHELGRQIHADCPFSSLCLMAYNGSGAYMAPPIGFEQGGYEVMRGTSFPRPGEDPLSPRPRRVPVPMNMGTRVVEEARKLLERLHRAG